MADGSTIEWTDATVNFWWGCTKVGPGCDHCYAETFDRRTGGAHWGLGAPRRKIASAVKLIRRLDNGYADWAADREVRVGNAKAFGLPVPMMGSRRRVFIQSMSDLFDLEVDLSWFAEAWELIEACDRLEIQIVTKRISVVEKRLNAIGRTAWPRHAGLILTTVTQDEIDRDVPRLLDLTERFALPWIGLSCEPLIEAIRLPGGFLALGKHAWTIVGGESGGRARPFDVAWAKSLIDQCTSAGAPIFVKQVGAHVIQNGERRIKRDRKGGDMSEWPHEIRVRQFPEPRP